MYSKLVWKSRVKQNQHNTEAVGQACSVKKLFLEISQNSPENACARVSFLIERLWKRRFPVNFEKFLRTPALTEHLRWLLLTIRYCFKTQRYSQPIN